MISILSRRYANLNKQMQDRMQMLAFALFIALASLVATLLGFVDAPKIGQVSGSILGVEGGYLIADFMRRIGIIA